MLPRLCNFGLDGGEWGSEGGQQLLKPLGHGLEHLWQLVQRMELIAQLLLEIEQVLALGQARCCNGRRFLHFHGVVTLLQTTNRDKLSEPGLRI